MKDALLVVDVQKDFCPGGALAVGRGDEVIPCCNALVAAASSRGVCVFVSRDWHPENHCSFAAFGGMWPSHCVAGSEGAQFHDELKLTDDVVTINKATESHKDAYSAFEDTGLLSELRRRGATRLFVAGLATDYCVVATVLDGLAVSFDMWLVKDGCRGVNVAPGDSLIALQRMSDAGARLVNLKEVLKTMGIPS